METNNTMIDLTSEEIIQLKQDFNANNIIEFMQASFKNAHFVSIYLINTIDNITNLVIFTTKRVLEPTSDLCCPYAFTWNSKVFRCWLLPAVEEFELTVEQSQFSFLDYFLLDNKYCLWVNQKYTKLNNFIIKYKNELSNIFINIKLETLREAIVNIIVRQLYKPDQIWGHILSYYNYLKKIIISDKVLNKILTCKKLTISEIKEVVEGIKLIYKNNLNEHPKYIIQYLELYAEYLNLIK